MATQLIIGQALLPVPQHIMQNVQNVLYPNKVNIPPPNQQVTPDTRLTRPPFPNQNILSSNLAYHPSNQLYL